MNKRGNLLNGSLLGSSGRSTRIYLQALQSCITNTSARLFAGRLLKSSIESSAIIENTPLRRGQAMKAILNAQAVTYARLYGWVAVAMSAQVNAVASTTAFLTHCKAKGMQGATSAVAQTVGKLTHYKAQFVRGSVSAIAQVNAVLSRLHKIKMSGVTTASAVIHAFLSRAKGLSAHLYVQATSSAKLTESTRVPAPTERVAKVPEQNRISIILGH